MCLSACQVADGKTPTNWSWPNVTLLSVKQQQQLPLRTANLLPYNNYARKALGYLYAIAHGADIIYETDDDNGPKEGMLLAMVLVACHPPLTADVVLPLLRAR